ncbi:LacI family DNA-binding transcriptional regulator [Niveispirillum sp. KHB5.9]|uniref:LacI family DNA-binding transcriptional regulator n=1 Tax=Niveispirillum sp. KHB5.9 TaxID=3400269 RepID=UPI003A83DF36
MSKPTIHDVARVAGVSIKTVSRVLNGEPKASPATRERVMAAVATLDYSPNLSARSLSAARNYMIAFVFGTYPELPNMSLQNEYIAGLQVGAVTAARAAGFHLLVEPLEMTPDRFSERAARLISMPAVDGFIIMPGLADDPRLLAVLAQRPGCYVRVSPGVEMENLPAIVRIDDYRAAADMTRHLLDLGHRHIGFIGGRPNFGSAELRFQAFRDVMNAAGVFDPTVVRSGDYTRESGRAAGAELLALDQRPTAIFAANDGMAIGVMALAHERGLRVPTDLSVAGIDDITMAASIWPALTTVRQPIIAMGAAAAGYIVAASTTGTLPPPLPFFPHELVVRDSTAAPSSH